jgi:glycosyltransferase involved in cell wall biosynthesis
VKILHVVTLASPDGAFGGPLRVALNQAAELSRRGHEVHIAAGWRGKTPPPEALGATPAKLFSAIRLIPPMGFSGMVSPGLAWWLLRNIATYDVVHIHAGRDLISTTALAVARAAQRPYVTQTHGMVQPDHRLKARVLDAIAVRRLLLAARRRFVLTQHEHDGLLRVLRASVACEQLPNGVPPARDEQEVDRGRGRQVLFCARLHRRKRPVAFVDMAGELVARGVSATFALVGPDDGDLPAVKEAIAAAGLQKVVHYEGALGYAAVLARMKRADVYVLPSVNEPFPMSLLEALSLGLPCVCTNTCDIAELLLEHNAALVTDGSVTSMADAVAAILEDPSLRDELGQNAMEIVIQKFSMNAVGDQLERAYAGISGGGAA